MSKTVVFDLDDTLVKEIDYLKSAFYEIANYLDHSNHELYDKMLEWYIKKHNVFALLCNIYPKTNLEELKIRYRGHFPNFNEYTYIKDFLRSIKQQGYFLGLITDGYSITQRNKLKALGIECLFHKIIISEEFGSEKPSIKNYTAFHEFNSVEYFYVGDNFKKDFIIPNQLGWNTVGIKDNGLNIHQQDFNLPKEYLPKIMISKLEELNQIIS